MHVLLVSLLVLYAHAINCFALMFLAAGHKLHRSRTGGDNGVCFPSVILPYPWMHMRNSFLCFAKENRVFSPFYTANKNVYSEQLDLLSHGSSSSALWLTANNNYKNYQVGTMTLFRADFCSREALRKSTKPSLFMAESPAFPSCSIPPPVLILPWLAFEKQNFWESLSPPSYLVETLQSFLEAF